ncbi:MAG: UDP-N-acetylenolpyruvoylglucosamine reductase [Candidatus Saccharibacteria bacterium]|nr:UDP-N-acetylenolpyruvoylglucosamine reductase [Candidatus Saccharibacteria bacterium]
MFSTMRLGGKAAYLTHILSEDDLTETVAWAHKHKVPFIMIGGGANIIFSDKGFKGLIMVNEISGIDIKANTVTIGAGEIWDEVVTKTLEAGLSGIESLSKIPGKTGAAPVQNIGAYGQEIAQVLKSVRAYDIEASKFVELSNSDCHFDYRASRFNRADKGRFLITQVTLSLHKAAPKPPYYRDVQSYIDEHHIIKVTPQIIREAVTAIRAYKLPDPSVVANCGSFFYNPIIGKSQFEKLALKYPAINHAPSGWAQPPRWFLDDGKVKISAAWLLQQAGFTDYEDLKTGLALWPYQNLVVINKKAKRTKDLQAFTGKIISTVDKTFGIKLQQEPELIGA